MDARLAPSFLSSEMQGVHVLTSATAAPLLQICRLPTRRRNLLGNLPYVRPGCAAALNTTSVGLSLSTKIAKDLYSRTGPLTALGVPTTPGNHAP